MVEEEVTPSPSGSSSAGGSGIVIVRYQIASVSTAKATGGAISFYGGKTIHTFTSSGTFTNPSSISNAEIVMVAGGGSGGTNIGGGGGAGGVLEGTSPYTSGNTIYDYSWWRWCWIRHLDPGGPDGHCLTRHPGSGTPIFHTPVLILGLQMVVVKVECIQVMSAVVEVDLVVRCCKYRPGISNGGSATQGNSPTPIGTLTGYGNAGGPGYSAGSEGKLSICWGWWCWSSRCCWC